jgi:DNA invertase Pin-like site-specific DNA recombinase
MFTMLGAIVEFERELMNERTAEGEQGPKSKGNIWDDQVNQGKT